MVLSVICIPVSGDVQPVYARLRSAPYGPILNAKIQSN